ncbi:DMT family transporter [Kangiella sp.]|uniref:DMT family transporter n=1 Tax=Kangiella sp. TaxID=1920245 RepID=UPI003A949F9B
MLLLMALFAGALISLQAGLNSQLGVLLKNSLMATVVAFVMSVLVSGIALFSFTNQWPDWSAIRTVPWYLWLGGVLSATGVGLFYFLIPKMGVGTMMSYALTGQLVLAVVASHFGWFGLPQMPLNQTKVIGLAAMIGGLVLLNR